MRFRFFALFESRENIEPRPRSVWHTARPQNNQPRPQCAHRAPPRTRPPPRLRTRASTILRELLTRLRTNAFLYYNCAIGIALRTLDRGGGRFAKSVGC